MKIMLDPGHVGGSAFDLRDFVFLGNRFREGDFCYLWSRLVAEKLRERGFIIEMTRSEGQPSLSPSDRQVVERCAELLAKHPMEFLLKKYHVPVALFPQHSAEHLFEAVIANEFDLLSRARIINLSGADLCLSLHLNGDPRMTVSVDNGICGFTNAVSRRYLERFSRLIGAMATRLELPLFEKLPFEQPNPGTYVREDLIMCNSVQKPFLLLEGPFQNNQTSLQQLVQAQTIFAESGIVTGILEGLVDSLVDAMVELERVWK